MARGAKKGENRFAGAQGELIQKRAKGIQDVLGLCAKTNIYFSSISKLANHIVVHINTAIEQSFYDGRYGGKRISKSTLLRNEAYRRLLNAYMMGKKEIEKNASKAQLFALKSENAELKDRLNRLEQHILTSENCAEVDTIGRDSLVEKEKLAYSHLIIRALIEASDELFKIVDDTIVDTSRASSRAMLVDEGVMKKAGFMTQDPCKELEA
ncbi:MAG: hypothetical protein CMF48_03330 [Legionellales bacterium]|nr:hypothetical protein [Legionellales bacterium]